MKSTRRRKPGSGKETMIQVPFETLLDSFAEGAALIGPKGEIVHMNERLLEMVGPANGRPCHEVLAKLSENCPICPFDELITGTGEPVKNKTQVRWGRTCRVNLRCLSRTGEGGPGGFILETVEEVASVEHSLSTGRISGNAGPPTLQKLGGLLLISRDLMGKAEMKEKMVNVLNHVAVSLGEPAQVTAWVELDDILYGSRPTEPEGPVAVQEIKVEDQPRGKLCTMFNPKRDPLPEEEYFLEEVADLIGRQVEIADLEIMLRKSEEKSKKLAQNLKKEMWSRTEALAKETGYLQAMLRCSDDVIITTDLDSRIVEFNPAAERILGYSAEEMQGKKVTDLWVEASEREKIMYAVTHTGGIQNYETRLLKGSGEVCEISLTLSLLKDEQGKTLGTVGVSKDIGRERAVRRELEQLNWNFREAIHFISHETKNSLIVIAGFVRRLMETETDPQRKEQLKIVYHHSAFLEAMSRDFLVLADLEQGGSLRKELVKDFYQEVILPAMVGLKERYPDSFSSYDESMGGVGAIRLVGDKGLLEVVYRNLFGNALKYGIPGGKIAYGVVDTGDSYVFNVWNRGPGVAHDQVEKIFEKFYRVRDESTRDKRGTGLGLYNIRKIIEAHGGHIWCETKPGEWINFLFRIPKGFC
jgi:PAS domain S-box-containing protein